MTGAPVVAADAVGHELLLRLAGRLPDELHWRLRDWLAAGARPVVAEMLPRVLLRNRIGLTAEELDRLGEAVDGWGGSRRLLDAVSSGPVAEREHRFRSGPEPLDAAALSVLGVVRGHPGCLRVARAVRLDGGRALEVVLVHGGERPWQLAGTLQRVLRAHGRRIPCVEVLPGDGAVDQPAREQQPVGADARACDVGTDARACEQPVGGLATAYHRAALAVATPLWQRDRAARGTPVAV